MSFYFSLFIFHPFSVQFRLKCCTFSIHFRSIFGQFTVHFRSIFTGSLQSTISFYIDQRIFHITDALGQDVLRQAQMVKSLFENQREFILISTGFDFSDSPHLTNPMGSGPAQASKMREIKAFAARHTYSPHAPHLHFIGDTIGALGWVVAGDRPSHFIRESYDLGKHHVKHIPGNEKSLKMGSEINCWKIVRIFLIAHRPKICDVTEAKTAMKIVRSKSVSKVAINGLTIPKMKQKKAHLFHWESLYDSAIRKI